MLLKDILNNLKGNKIETITNSNGTAIKFGDGTMICHGTKTMSASYGTVNFPVAFVENPMMIATLNATVSNDSIYIISTNVSSNSVANIFARKNDNTAVATEIDVTWQAIGKWK